MGKFSKKHRQSLKEKMTKINVETIKEYKKIFDDIESLKNLILQYGLNDIIETYPIEDMIGHPRDYKKCNIENLSFKITSSSQKPIPSVKLLNVSIILTYEYNTIDGIHDVFNDYQFNLEIKGYDKDSDTNQKFFYWHLDKEPNTDGCFTHPLYHFHAGGKNMKDKIDESIDHFVISSPRLAHPPMDLILSIHFLIQNFINGKEYPNKKRLIEDEGYIGIIERAQKRVLDPYFAAISGKTTHIDYKRTNLFPLYV